MELTLTVNDNLARKIKGLSALTGQTAADITQNLSGHIEGLINQELIKSIGIAPEDLEGPITHRSGFSRLVGPEDNPTAVFNSIPKTEEEEVQSFSMVEGLGGSEDSFDDYDDELPNHMVEKLNNSALPENERPREELPQKKAPVEEPIQEKPVDELIFPEETEELEEEELLMPIKDKEGNDAGYKDAVMNDFQDELESGDLDGVSDDEYDFDDDEREFEEDTPKRGNAKVSGHIPSDAPAAEGYENAAPDVLPMDYGIKQVSAEDGKVNGAIDFFNNAFEGIQGDKTARNNVQRKRIITGF